MLGWHLADHMMSFHKPKDELVHLFFSGVARRVSMTLLAIFSPIYIYRLGFELFSTQKNALMTVVSFYFIAFIFKLIAMLVSEEVSRRIGFISTIRLSVIPFVMFTLSLVFAPYSPLILLLTAAMTWGIHIGSYWWGYHGFFVKVGELKHLGSEIGEAGFLETIAVTVTPILGALTVKYMGFGALFVVSTFFILVSMVFLNIPHDQMQKKDARFINVIRFLIKKKDASLSYIGFSVQSTLHAVIWPIFLVIILGDILNLGLIVSFAALIASVVSMLMGEWVDAQGERKAILYGAPMVFVSWIIRAIKPTFTFFIIAESLWNLGELVVSIPLNSLSYKKAMDEGGTAQGILFRETALTIGSFVSLIILGVFIMAEIPFGILFTVVAFISIMTMLIVKGKNN